MRGILSFVKTIGGIVAQNRRNSALEAYYQASTEARLRSIENNKILTREENEVALKISDIRADALDVEANQLFADSFTLSNLALQNLEAGNRAVSFQVGQARNAFASAGVAQQGSVNVTIDSIANNSFRDVDNQFKASLDRINRTLSASAQTHFDASLQRYQAEAQAVLSQTRADVAT